MITLTLSDGSQKKFNLKSFEREKTLKNAWFAMTGDKKYEKKKFVIKLPNETLTYRLKDITLCEFDKAVFVQGEVFTP